MRPQGVKAEILAANFTGVPQKAPEAFVASADDGAAQQVGHVCVLAAVDTLVICKARVVSTALATLRVPLWQVAQVARVPFDRCIEMWLSPDGHVPSRESLRQLMHLCWAVLPAGSWCGHSGLGDLTGSLQLTQHGTNPVPLPVREPWLPCDWKWFPAMLRHSSMPPLARQSRTHS